MTPSLNYFGKYYIILQYIMLNFILIGIVELKICSKDINGYYLNETTVQNS